MLGKFINNSYVILYTQLFEQKYNHGLKTKYVIDNFVEAFFNQIFAIL